MSLVRRMYDVMLDEAKLWLDERKVESSSPPAPPAKEDSGYDYEEYSSADDEMDPVKEAKYLQQDNEWLNLYGEIALSSERPDMETCLPLEVKKVVVRTKEDVEPSMKLKSSNVIFYMIFKTRRAHECKAIIRQTRDGIQGHMCLEVSCMLGK
ncbi:unnamed protein product [Eruca vesicaria subsp. sativa]|uniref:Uncharacterized protein n=1 Tax=Eruca vesicaria subsp. sativa TaxID=29727 RepID=A0ABC8JJ20_ERUVS|nr:unnamed protein product [Eruca vesicaria subsp. sativa]